MRLFLLSIIFIFLVTSCKSLPVIMPIDSSDGMKTIIEYRPFLKNKSRLTHSIYAELPNGDNSSLIGVTVADPESGNLHAVLMSIEGLVLFDAEYKNNAININRAVPPLGSMDFAETMMQDISLFYFAPEYNNSKAGINEAGKFTRRFDNADGKTLYLTDNKDGTGFIYLYDSSYNLIRTVRLSKRNKDGIPENIKLISHGFFGYSLNLKLIEYEVISIPD